MPSAKPNPALERVSKICHALPDATREFRGDHASFTAKKKVFAYFLNNHHNDGIVSIACKAFPGDNTALVAAQPERFYLPAYIGPRGWVALRLDAGKVDWTEVKALIEGSYHLCTAKKPRRTAALPSRAGTPLPAPNVSPKNRPLE